MSALLCRSKGPRRGGGGPEASGPAGDRGGAQRRAAAAAGTCEHRAADIFPVIDDPVTQSGASSLTQVLSGLAGLADARLLFEGM